MQSLDPFVVLETSFNLFLWMLTMHVAEVDDRNG